MYSIKTALALATVATAAAMGSGCSTPPQPPTVDDSMRRPVNNPHQIDLQRCASELTATRVSLLEANHQATRAAAIAVGAAQASTERCTSTPAQPALSAAPINQAAAASGATMKVVAGTAPIAASISPPVMPPSTSTISPQTAPPSGRVFVLHFKLGSAELQLNPADAAVLFEASAAAELVVVRGRTDALKDSPAETALARRRALAAGEFLIVQGNVPRHRVRLQWQGAGDALVEGHGATQREANRRVEVETYAVAPQREARLIGLRSVVIDR